MNPHPTPRAIALTPAEISAAKQRRESGELLKSIAWSHKISVKTLSNALAGRGAYAGVPA